MRFSCFSNSDNKIRKVEEFLNNHHLFFFFQLLEVIITEIFQGKLFFFSLFQYTAYSGMGILTIIDRVFVCFFLCQFKVEIEMGVWFLFQKEESGCIDTNL